MSLPRLHVVTDDTVLAAPDFLERAMDVLATGGPRVALHVRGPRTSAGAVFHNVEALMRAAADSGAALVVNDRVDVALASGLSWAHLGQRSLPVPSVRELLGPESTLGRSCHSNAAVAEAAREGADYVFLGTLYATPSHPERAGVGPGAISSALDKGVPVIGIGGIEADRVPELLQAGAYGVAVVRGVWGASDPIEAMERYLQALEGE